MHIFDISWFTIILGCILLTHTISSLAPSPFIYELGNMLLKLKCRIAFVEVIEVFSFS